MSFHHIYTILYIFSVCVFIKLIFYNTIINNHLKIQHILLKYDLLSFLAVAEHSYFVLIYTIIYILKHYFKIFDLSYLQHRSRSYCLVIINSFCFVLFLNCMLPCIHSISLFYTLTLFFLIN